MLAHQPTTDRIDWSEIVVDLRRADWTYEDIGAVVGKSTGWAWKVANIPNTSLRFEDGEKMLTAWAATVGKTTSEAPRISRS